MPMKTSLKGMLILSVYYILVLPIKFVMYNCVSHTLCFIVLDMPFHMGLALY